MDNQKTKRRLASYRSLRLEVDNQLDRLARDAYQVTESTGWRKVDCAHCGKRRYGAECALGRKEKKDDQERV